MVLVISRRNKAVATGVVTIEGSHAQFRFPIQNVARMMQTAVDVTPFFNSRSGEKMNRTSLILGVVLSLFPAVEKGFADEPSSKQTVASEYPNYKGEWYHYSKSKTIELLQLGQYSSRDPKAPPRYHVGLVFVKDDPKQPQNHYGQATKVELTKKGGLKITLPPGPKGEAKPELVVLLKGEVLELEIPAGPFKGAYKLEKQPRLTDRKTVYPNYQEGWGDATGKGSLAELRFYPCVEQDETTRPVRRYYVTVKSRNGDNQIATDYFGPAKDVKEIPGGGLKVTLPPAKNEEAEREFTLKREGDHLMVHITKGPLTGDHKLKPLPPFDHKKEIPDYRGEWAPKGETNKIRLLQFLTYDSGDGPPVVRYHVGLVFIGDDPKDREGYYGQAESVEEDAKKGLLRVILPPRKEGEAKRELHLKRVKDVLEVHVLSGKFKGTYPMMLRMSN